MKKPTAAQTSHNHIREKDITAEPKQMQESKKTNNDTTVKLLFTAAFLFLIAGCIFAFGQQWVKAALLLIGTFGCAVAALNFKKHKESTNNP